MKKDLTIFDSPKSRRMVRWILFQVCLILLIVGLFPDKHGDFYWERVPNFFAAYGFISCVSLILIAKVLRKILKRDEIYYDK